MLPALHSNSDLFDLLLSRDALAGLVAYGATRLACGLAGASAFAATRDLLFLRFCDRTNHSRISPLAVFSYYTTRIEFLQVIFYIHEILFELTKRISVRLRETQQSPLALCSVSLCASSRNKIAPAHSLFRKSQRVGKLSTAAERRDFPCGIIIAKGRLASLETIIEKKRELLAKIFSKKRFLQKKRQAFRDLALPNPCIMRLAVTRFTKFFSN